MTPNKRAKFTHAGTIACQGCGTGLVCAVEINGVVFLHSPPFLVEVGRCRCSVCGSVLHWNGRRQTVSDIEAMRLVDKTDQNVIQ